MLTRERNKLSLYILCWKPSRSRTASDPWHQWRIPCPSSQQNWADWCCQTSKRKWSRCEAESRWSAGNPWRSDFWTLHFPGEDGQTSVCHSIQSSFNITSQADRISWHWWHKYHRFKAEWHKTTKFVFLSCTYHVSKVGHAKAVRLDAFISQDVVNQNILAVVEPDLLAMSLLWWRAVGPPCQSERGIVREGNRIGKL